MSHISECPFVNTIYHATDTGLQWHYQKLHQNYAGSHKLAGITSTASINKYEEENNPDTAPEFDMDFDGHDSSEVEKRIYEFVKSQINDHGRLDSDVDDYVDVHNEDEELASFAMNPVANPAEPTNMTPDLLQHLGSEQFNIIHFSCI